MPPSATSSTPRLTHGYQFFVESADESVSVGRFVVPDTPSRCMNVPLYIVAPDAPSVVKLLALVTVKVVETNSAFDEAMFHTMLLADPAAYVVVGVGFEVNPKSVSKPKTLAGVYS
jgi:hypothetical protein